MLESWSQFMFQAQGTHVHRFGPSISQLLGELTRDLVEVSKHGCFILFIACSRFGFMDVSVGLGIQIAVEESKWFHRTHPDIYLILKVLLRILHFSQLAAAADRPATAHYTKKRILGELLFSAS